MPSPEHHKQWENLVNIWMNPKCYNVLKEMFVDGQKIQISQDGSIYFLDEYGNTYREKGPSMIDKNGNIFYQRHKLLENEYYEDFPSEINPDGSISWNLKDMNNIYPSSYGKQDAVDLFENIFRNRYGHKSKFKSINSLGIITKYVDNPYECHKLYPDGQYRREMHNLEQECKENGIILSNKYSLIISLFNENFRLYSYFNDIDFRYDMMVIQKKHNDKTHYAYISYEGQVTIE